MKTQYENTEVIACKLCKHKKICQKERFVKNIGCLRDSTIVNYNELSDITKID